MRKEMLLVTKIGILGAKYVCKKMVKVFASHDIGSIIQSRR